MQVSLRGSCQSVRRLAGVTQEPLCVAFSRKRIVILNGLHVQDRYLEFTTCRKEPAGEGEGSTGNEGSITGQWAC